MNEINKETKDYMYHPKHLETTYFTLRKYSQKMAQMYKRNYPNKPTFYEILVDVTEQETVEDIQKQLETNEYCIPVSQEKYIVCVFPNDYDKFSQSFPQHKEIQINSPSKQIPMSSGSVWKKGEHLDNMMNVIKPEDIDCIDWCKYVHLTCMYCGKKFDNLFDLENECGNHCEKAEDCIWKEIDIKSVENAYKGYEQMIEVRKILENVVNDNTVSVTHTNQNEIDKENEIQKDTNEIEGKEMMKEKKINQKENEESETISEEEKEDNQKEAKEEVVDFNDYLLNTQTDINSMVKCLICSNQFNSNESVKHFEIHHHEIIDNIISVFWKKNISDNERRNYQYQRRDYSNHYQHHYRNNYHSSYNTNRNTTYNNNNNFNHYSNNNYNGNNNGFRPYNNRFVNNSNNQNENGMRRGRSNSRERYEKQNDNYQMKQHSYQRSYPKYQSNYNSNYNQNNNLNNSNGNNNQMNQNRYQSNHTNFNQNRVNKPFERRPYQQNQNFNRNFNQNRQFNQNYHSQYYQNNHQNNQNQQQKQQPSYLDFLDSI